MMAMSRLIIAVLAASSLSMLTAAPAPKLDGPAAELKLLEGLWEVESVTLGGKSLPMKVPPVKYEFKGSRMTLAGTNGLRIIEVDGSKNPKQMTQTEAELKNGSPMPKAGGQVNRAIYKVDGDKLILVIGRGPKADFPKSITPEAGDPVLVMTLKRIKN